MATRTNALNLSNDTLLRAYAGATGGGSLPPNGVINGSMNVNQRGAASYTIASQTGAYTLDGWYVVNALGGNTVPSAVVTPVAGATPGAKAMQISYGSTGAGGGYIYVTQTLPAAVVAGWQGQKIGVSLNATCSSGSIMATGGNNGLLLQVWYSTNTTDTNLMSPVNLQTNATGENALNSVALNAYQMVTPSWTNLTSVTLDSLPATATQVMLCIGIHINGPQTQSTFGTLTIDDLYIGPTNTPAYTPEPKILELDRCRQFYQTSYPIGTAPGTPASTAAAFGYLWINMSGISTSPGGSYGYLRWPVPMFYAPSVTCYSSTNGTAGCTSSGAGGADNSPGTAVAYLISPVGCGLYNAGSGSNTPANGNVCLHYVANCSL